MTLEEILAPIVDSIARDSSLPRAQILAALSGWEAVPLVLDGQLAACAIVRGPEIHFACHAAHRRRFTARRVRAFLAPLIARHGYLTTRVRAGRAAPARFVARIGFAPTWSDGTFDYYLLAGEPLPRRSR